MQASLATGIEMSMLARSPAFEPLAAQVIENYEEMNPHHLPGGPPDPLYDLENPAYAIITTPGLEAPAETLATWKTKKDDAAGRALLRAQELILQDMPFVLLYFKTTVRASNQRFEMPLHPLQYRLYKLARPL